MFSIKVLEFSISVNGTLIAHKHDLMYRLHVIRDGVLRTRITYKQSIQIYTEMISGILSHTTQNVRLPGGAEVWKHMLAIGTLLRASNVIGIQRALGAVFLILCGHDDPEDQVWFDELAGQSKAYLSLTFSNYPAARASYQRQYEGTQLQADILEMESRISGGGSGNLEQQCTNWTTPQLYRLSNNWFKNMTSYIIILQGIREDITTDMLYVVQQLKGNSQNNLITYIVVLTVVLVVSVALSVWYTREIRLLMIQMADRISSTTLQNLYREKVQSRAQLVNRPIVFHRHTCICIEHIRTFYHALVAIFCAHKILKLH